MSDEYWVEFGVLFDDGDIIECADDTQARAVADRQELDYVGGA